jgi:integrase
MSTKQLTQRDADNLAKPTGLTETGKPKNQSFLWCGRLKGFGIRCTSEGTKAWVAQGRVNTKERRITIGSHALLSCDEARRRAKNVLLQMEDGIDPVAEAQRTEAQATTLAEVAEDYIVHRRTKHGALRQHTIADIRRHCEKALGAWKDQPIRNITSAMVLAKFKELSKTRTAQANQAMIVFQACHGWARKANPDLPANLVKDTLKGMWHPSVPRTERIPFDKLGAAWRLLEQRCAVKDRKGTAVAASAVSFQILTGMRWGEVSGLTWDRVDLEGKVPSWHLDSDLAKNHNDIRVPLSTQAVALLKAMPRVKGSPYVFPQHKNPAKPIGNPQALWDTLRDLSELSRLSSHDMRRTFLAVALKCGVETVEGGDLDQSSTSVCHAHSLRRNKRPARRLCR